MVTEELGRPVAVDIPPTHAVALGAARLAAPPEARPASPPPPGPAPGIPVPETEPEPETAPVAPVDATDPLASTTVEPEDRARRWRRGRRLAWAGLAALTVAALAWPTAGNGDRRPESPSAAGTDEPAAGGGRVGDGPGGSRGSNLNTSVTGDAGREGQGAREPSSPGTPGAGQGSSRGGTSPGGTGAGTGGGGAPTTAPPSPRPGTTTPGPTPTTAPPQPVVRPWHAVEAGTCLNDVSPHPPATITSAEVRGCDTPHGYEVMGVLDN